MENPVLSKEHYKKIMDLVLELYAHLEKDIVEEGHDWNVSKQSGDTAVKYAQKKTIGPEIYCYQGISTIVHPPADLLRIIREEELVKVCNLLSPNDPRNGHPLKN
jgi:hypothetical protein